MSKKLKPCPFCGGKVIISETGEDGFHWFTVTRPISKHNRCSCRVFMESKQFYEDVDPKIKNKIKQDLIKRWNQRKFAVNPNLIKAIRCLASKDDYGSCHMTKYNRDRGDKPEMTCKGLMNTIQCPYSQEEYDTDFRTGGCENWINEVADLLEGKE